MNRLIYRMAKVEQALDLARAKAAFVFVEAGETQEQAIERTGPHDGAKYLLIIDIHKNHETIDAEIERTIRELKRKGVSSAEIDAALKA